MTRASRVKLLEKTILIDDAVGSTYRMPLAFFLVAGLRAGYDPEESIAVNLAATLGIGHGTELRRHLATDPAGLGVASRHALARLMRERGAVVSDVPLDDELHRHIDVLDEMFADLPEGVRRAVPFACAADWFL